MACRWRRLAWQATRCLRAEARNPCLTEPGLHELQTAASGRLLRRRGAEGSTIAGGIRAEPSDEVVA